MIAASWQQSEEKMIKAIQIAYYLRAMNPSNPETLADLAAGLGLDRSLFVKDLGSAQTETELRRQFSLRANLNVRSFPTLVLESNSACTFIAHDYHDCRVSLEEIESKMKTGTD